MGIWKHWDNESMNEKKTNNKWIIIIRNGKMEVEKNLGSYWYGVNQTIRTENQIKFYVVIVVVYFAVFWNETKKN